MGPSRRARPAAAGVLVVGVLAVLALLVWSGRSPAAVPAATGSPTTPIQSGAAPTGSPSPSPAGVPSSAAPGEASSPPSPGASVANRIRIPRLKIDLPIVEGDGVDAPLDSAAHYPGTAWPGGGSNIYIYAHARTGLFLSLWDVRQGDEVLLDTVDGRTVTYVVDEIRPKTPWDAVELLEPTDEERLTLQTSTSYTATAPRFVVIALPRP